jgi:DNA-directed RNA polymerase specialized sigma24 family protein
MEANMIQIKKTPLDLIDDIYSLAFWMTGNENTSRDLVSQTYMNVDIDAPETELLKVFRECYIDNFGQAAGLDMHGISANTGSRIIDSLRHWAADIKLSVLLSEISGLKHRQISDIMEKPVETIRLWLFWGRKFLINDNLLKASA